MDDQIGQALAKLMLNLRRLDEWSAEMDRLPPPTAKALEGNRLEISIPWIPPPSLDE